MTTFDQRKLQADLLDLFDRHGVMVAVGLIADGVAIRSQDERVDASNIGIPVAKPATADDNPLTDTCPTCGLLESTLGRTNRCGLRVVVSAQKPCFIRDRDAR